MCVLPPPLLLLPPPLSKALPPSPPMRAASHRYRLMLLPLALPSSWHADDSCHAALMTLLEGSWRSLKQSEQPRAANNEKSSSHYLKDGSLFNLLFILKPSAGCCFIVTIPKWGYTLTKHLFYIYQVMIHVHCISL